MSIETYFRGRLDAAARMGDVQRELEASLPNLFVPNIMPGEAVALRPYQLRDDLETRSLAISFNQLTYIAFEYPGYEQFQREGLDVLEPALAKLGVDELTRVVYSYDNRVDMPVLADGSLPLEHVLNLNFPTWLGTDGFVQLDLQWRKPWSQGMMEGRISQEDERGSPVLHIELRAVAEPVGAITNLPDFVAATHAQAVELFDSMITDEFKDFLARSADPTQGD